MNRTADRDSIHRALSVRRLAVAGSVAATVLCTGFLVLLYALTGESGAVLAGLCYTLALCAVLGGVVALLRRKIARFTGELCADIDRMMAGEEALPARRERETLLSRTQHKLERLYEVTRENQRRIDSEKQTLQELVSDISHQVKTPLANLKMVTATLLERPLPDERRAALLQAMDGQLDKLEFLLQSMIKLSRLEIGVLALHPAPALLCETIADALGAVVLPAEKKGLIVAVACDQTRTVRHDRRWLAEALFNLLDNAVKYTEPDGRLDVTVTPQELYTRIEVRDTGRGIAERYHGSIFRRFFREREVHHIEGVGIGLYLTREIVTLHGGYVMVQSQPGQGSVFSVYLPNR